MSLIQIYFVDAFTTNENSAFTGNPAAVCFLDYDVKDDISDEMKQKIASEINLSETAFVSYGWTQGQKLMTAEGSQLYRRTLRWFTPTNEVELCGHATVASAKALCEAQLTDAYLLYPEMKNLTINFESKFSGKLGAAMSKNSGKITLNFPSNPCHDLNKAEHPWIDECILTILGNGVSPNCIVDVQYSPSTKILLLRLADNLSPEDLRKVSPDFKKLVGLNTRNFVHDVIVTIKGSGGDVSKGAPHFYSRFFAPWDGIDEDPVTGLAHTVLTPYWTQVFSKSESKEIGTLLARQHSIRGGNVYCTLLGDRVNLAGEARVIIKGQLFI